jgi:hypothetical protein
MMPNESNPNISNKVLQHRALQWQKRKEWLRRCNLPPNDTQKNLRLCNQHIFQKEVLKYTWIAVNRKNHDEETLVPLPSHLTDHQRMTQHNATSIISPNKRKRQPIVKVVRTSHKHRIGTQAWCHYVGCRNKSSMGQSHLKFVKVPNPSKKDTNNMKHSKNKTAE